MRWIDGSATLVTVLSSITMNSAKHIAASVHQRRFSSVMRMPRLSLPDADERSLSFCK